jgi:hypothetical protein
MSAYKQAIGWLAKTLSRRKPKRIVTTQRGYPFKGSLDANFQDYARKNLLNLKGFGSGPLNRVLRPDGTIGEQIVKKAPVKPKLKTVTGKQMRIPGMKSGGTLRKRNGNWMRK